jgi:hypothetical protein
MKYQKLYLKLIIFFSILIYSCQTKNTSEDLNTSSKDSVQFVPGYPEKRITTFLFVRNDLKIDELINLLNNSNIKFTQSKSNELLEFGHGVYYSLNDPLPMKSVKVYNYQLGDHILDTLNIYFLDDIFYSLNYGENQKIKYKNGKTKGIVEESFNSNFEKYDNVLVDFFEGLTDKYGLPDCNSKPDYYNLSYKNGFSNKVQKSDWRNWKNGGFDDMNEVFDKSNNSKVLISDETSYFYARWFSDLNIELEKVVKGNQIDKDLNKEYGFYMEMEGWKEFKLNLRVLNTSMFIEEVLTKYKNDKELKEKSDKIKEDKDRQEFLKKL